MEKPIKPAEALVATGTTLPLIAPCEHYAGSERLILKAFELQQRYGAALDVTCDCEDGAAAGSEREHAMLIGKLIAQAPQSASRIGVRIHDPRNRFWRDELDILLREAGSRIAYITIPKAESAAEVRQVCDHARGVAQTLGFDGAALRFHVLIETHGALNEVWQIAALDGLEVLDFGLLDFISVHHGAIPRSAMKSPGQFEHQLLRRAKAEISAAAIAHHLVPAHCISLALRDESIVYEDALRARREFGFLRMWSIHPMQIPPIIRAMQPDFSDVKFAEAVLIEAQQRNWGPIEYQGELHDRASYRFFWDLLQRARLSCVELSEAAKSKLF